MKNFFLILSGSVDGLIAALHLMRFFAKWTVSIGPYEIPLKGSFWAAVVFLLLSLGCFTARGQKS